jgi:hypothetical protein
MLHRLAVVVVTAIMVSAVASAKEPKRDPETGIIRLLYIGAPFQASAYQILRFDPLLSTTPVNGNLFGISQELVERAMRLYMPRTRGIMVTKYDVIGLDDTTQQAFHPQTIQWMVDGCLDDGLGIFMAGGYESFGGNNFPSWGDTVLDQIMPVESPPGRYTWADSKNVIAAPENELMKNMPQDDYDRYAVFLGHNIVRGKQSAQVLTHLVQISLTTIQDPGWVYWDVGEGRFFASASGFRGTSGKVFMRWKHYGDFLSSLVYFLAGLTPPEDIALLHAARQSFRDVYDQTQMVTGTIEFITRFGADTRRVDLKLEEADAKLGEARRYFVNLELEDSRQAADQVFEILGEAYELAIAAKDAALYWIFLAEWLVVSGTGLVVGVVVWVLMVRRKLYREVQVTRDPRL